MKANKRIHTCRYVSIKGEKTKKKTKGKGKELILKKDEELPSL